MKELDNAAKIKILFGANLKRLRGIANKSQVRLALEAGLSHNFINNIENGKKWASAETIGILASVLKVEPQQFFISDSEWKTEAAKIFSLCLDDFSGSAVEKVNEYRSRYLLDNSKEEKPGKEKKK